MNKDGGAGLQDLPGFEEAKEKASKIYDDKYAAPVEADRERTKPLNKYVVSVIGDKVTFTDDIWAAVEALTAIYEIGLECIGADETPPKMIKHYPGAINVVDGVVYPASSEEVHYHPETYAKNQLRASQRKAWAKACGVEL